MSKSKYFIYEARRGGFVANGIDVDRRIYFTIAVHEERYIQADELSIERDGSIPGIGWFADLIRDGIAEEISEERFRELLSEAIDLGCSIYNKVGQRYEEFLGSYVTSSYGIPVPSMEPVIEIHFDKRLSQKLKSRIDGCDFGTVKRYFRDPTSEISQVMIIQPPYKLEEVGAYLVDPSGHVGLSIGGGLVTRGIIVVGVDDMDAVNEDYRPYACLLDSIDDDESCDVLYLPPIYLVRLHRPKD